MAPPGSASAIWGLLFAASLMYAVYQASPFRATDPLLRPAGWYTVAALAMTSVWVSRSQFVGTSPIASAGFTALILACYLGALLEVGLGPRMYWFVTVPVSLLAGWFTVACGVNLAESLISNGVLPGVVVACVVATGAGLAGLLIPWLFGGGVWFAGPIAWGLGWVAIGNLEAGGSPIVVGVAGAAAFLVVAAATLPLIARLCPISPEIAARIAYAANLLILSPVLWSLFTHSGSGPLAAFNGTVQNEDGLRLLVASLWLAIMFLSVVGLARPRALIPVLALQVVYKSCYLGFFVVPTLSREGWEAVPLGVTVCFLAIVILWPAVIYLNVMTPPPESARTSTHTGR